MSFATRSHRCQWLVCAAAAVSRRPGSKPTYTTAAATQRVRFVTFVNMLCNTTCIYVQQLCATPCHPSTPLAYTISRVGFRYTAVVERRRRDLQCWQPLKLLASVRSASYGMCSSPDHRCNVCCLQRSHTTSWQRKNALS